MPIEELTILLPCHSLEDFPLYHQGAEAEGLLAAWTVLWHPALLNQVNKIPGWARCDEPPEEFANKLMILPQSAGCDLPSGYAKRVKEAGGVLLRKMAKRDELASAALAAIAPAVVGDDAESPPRIAPDSVDPVLVDEFYAVGMAYLWTELLTRRMRYMSLLEEVAFQDHILAAARASVAGDIDATRTALNGALDQLLQSRNHFYPVDCFLLDITLVAPSTIGPDLRAELELGYPTTLLIDGETLQKLAVEEPTTLAMIRARLQAGTLSILGGDESERQLTLEDVETILAGLKRGAELYERHLGEKPKFYGRRRAGLSPILPNLLTGLGYRAAFHVTLDEGRFPTGTRAKISWQGLGSHAIEAVPRVPLEAGEHGPMLSLPEKLGETMDYDHVATLVFAHWPGRTSPYYDDFRRFSAAIQVLGRFVTFQQFMDDTAGSGEIGEFKLDHYRPPYLLQDVIRKREEPLTKHVDETRMAVDANSSNTLRALSQTLADNDGSAFIKSLGHALGATFTESSDPQAGRLLFNPHSAAWRTGMHYGADRRAPQVGGPVLAADDAHAVVEIPPLGFAWIGESRTQTNTPPKSPGLKLWKSKPQAPQFIARDGKLINEFCEVTISTETGGIKSILAPGMRGNRLSQQLGFRLTADGETGWDEMPKYAGMIADEVRATVQSTVLGEYVVQGRIIDETGKEYAKFEQTTRLWAGSRVIELEIVLEPHEAPKSDPWNAYYACRWAWGNELLDLKRSFHETVQETSSKRIESPHFLQLSDERSSTTLLVNGLPYHVRSGYRMLDTLMNIRGEKPRRLRIGIGIDLPNPTIAARQFASRPAEHATIMSSDASSGWLFHVDAKGVILTALEPLRDVDAAGGERVVGIRGRLLETTGQAGAVRVSGFKPFLMGQRCHFTGEPSEELAVELGKIRIDLAAFDFAEFTARW